MRKFVYIALFIVALTVVTACKPVNEDYTDGSYSDANKHGSDPLGGR